MHLLLRKLHPFRAPAREGRGAVDDLAGLRRHADGRRRPPGGGDPRRDHEEVQGQLHPGGRGQPAAEPGRHELHHRRQTVHRAAQARREGREGHHQLGLLRELGLRAGRQAEPDAGHADPQGDLRQAHHQGAGLPADRRGDDRRDHLHANLRPHPRARSAGPAEDVRKRRQS